MMWKKHVGGWTTRDRKLPTIGQPVLVETTIEESLLSRLPTAQQAHLEARRATSPTLTPTTNMYYKELPPLEFQREQRSRIPRPVSEVPTSSSMYTRTTPEFRHDFDPTSRVSPLFSNSKREVVSENVQSYPPANNPTHGQLHSSLSDDSGSTARPTLEGNVRQTRGVSLGIETSVRRQWHGASGETEPMTPIASTPAATGSSRSVSPIDEGLQLQTQYPSNATNPYPTPESIDRKAPPELEEQPAPELRTPRVDQFDGACSIGYDVSPWSTPDSRPTYRHFLEQRTPERTPSYLRRSISASSPAYRRALAFKKRLSWQTRTTEDDKYTEFEVSTQGSERPSFEYGSVIAGPYARDMSGLNTPPAQQRSFSDGMTLQKQKPPGHQFSPPKFSRFSWTTQATQLTPPMHTTIWRPHVTPQQYSSPQTATNTPKEDTSILQASPLSPILTRRRPVPTSPNLDDHPAISKASANRQIRRKPTPSMLTIDPSPNEKALPTTPGELSTIDYITTLDAQLESLANRKHNILKMIEGQQSASFSPYANPMFIDLEKRRTAKEAVRVLEEELAEVRIKEHETGVKLMKAEKRRDQEAPSGLWVRRIHV